MDNVNFGNFWFIIAACFAMVANTYAECSGTATNAVPCSLMNVGGTLNAAEYERNCALYTAAGSCTWSGSACDGTVGCGV